MAEQPSAATAASSSIATSNEKSDEKISTNNKVHRHWRHFPRASNPTMSWDSMWSHMTGAGWIKVNGYGAESYYIDPQIKHDVLGLVSDSNNDWSFMEGEELDMVSSYTEGLHYFNSLQSLQQYAKEHLGWVGKGGTEVEKIRALNSGSRELLFKAVYLCGVRQTADIRLASLQRYYGENDMNVIPIGSPLEKSGLISISNNPIDTTYTVKVQPHDMEDAIGKDFYKKGFYKFILDRSKERSMAAPSDTDNDQNENKTQPLQQQENTANGMNNRKQPNKNRNRNEPINQEKDNTVSLQRTTVNTSNDNGTVVERRSTDSMSNTTNTSAVASTAVATDSSGPVSNAAPAKRVSLSPDTSKNLPKRITRVSRGNGQFDEKKKKNEVENEQKTRSLVSAIRKDWLTPKRGWGYMDGKDGETYAFIPGSLLETYKKGEVKNKGIRGIHWANGELELGEMLSTYGYLYAPSSLDDANPRKRGPFSIQDIYDDLFVDEKVGGKKKSGNSTSSAASTTTVAPVTTAKSKAATRERDGTAPSGGATTSSSSASSQAKAGTSGQAGLKRKTVEADDKRKKKQKKESNPSGNERKKQKIGNNSSSGSSSSNVVSTTVAAPVAVARSNNQDRAAETQSGVSSNTKKKDKKKSNSTKLTPNIDFMNKSISTLAQEYDSMSKEIEKNNQEIEKYKAKDLEYDNMSKAVDDSKKEMEELKERLGSKDSSINTLEKKLEGRNAFISRLQGKIDTQKKEIITLKNEGIEKDTEMTTLRNEKNKLEKDKTRLELEIQAYRRRMVSDERKHNASQAQQQRHDALTQSVSSEEDGMSEDDKELQRALAKTIVDENDLKVDWDDVAGLLEVKEQLKMATLAPIKFPSSFLGNRKALKGILLYGPPGTGKTHIAMAAASALSKEVDCTVFFIKASDIDSKWKGDSARLVKNLFDMARKGKRAIIFIDEVDSLCVSRDGAIDTTDQRIVTEFLNQMDGGVKNDNVLVIGATNLPWDLDTAMRRRFESRIHFVRLQLFKIHLGDTPSTLTENDIETLAQSTDGASGADIQVLVKKKALMEAVNEGQRSKHFRLEEDLYVPTLPCDVCPRQISMDQSNTCGCCGAMRMGFFDIPNDRFKARDVCMEDFKKYLKSSYSTVSEEELQQYAAWTKDFGEGGD